MKQEIEMDWLRGVPRLPRLAAGSHREGSGALCAMELVAFMEREPHSDKPECTCPVLAAYVRRLNDRMPNEQRQRLLPYLSRLGGTNDPEKYQMRAEMMAMRAVNVFAVNACRGRIADHLIDAMATATNLKSAITAADAAADAAAAADVAYAADAAADAAAAADVAYAADAAAAAAADAAYVWDDALTLLDDVIGDAPAREWPVARAIEAATITA